MEQGYCCCYMQGRLHVNGSVAHGNIEVPRHKKLTVRKYALHLWQSQTKTQDHRRARNTLGRTRAPDLHLYCW
eukprot:3305939-Amphidinium_carterae.1